MKYFLLALIALLPNLLTAQEEKKENKNDKYIESDVITLGGRKGFRWETKNGDFKLKPYMVAFTRAQAQYVDDEGLRLTEEDNIINTGFSIPVAIFGMAGTAFNRITYNIALNAAAAGSPALLNQAWININFKDELRLKVGKFKTPMFRNNLSRLGQKLFPSSPSSLNSPVNVPFSLNSANPHFNNGFDIGIMLHGVINSKFAYQAGIFNGTGINVNRAKNTLSDEYNLPSLLYSARLAYMPLGKMPLHEGDPSDLDNFKMSFAISSSYSVEANYESSDDLKIAAEYSLLVNKWYFSLEAYMMRMDFVERQKLSPDFYYYGTYAQVGYFINKKLQPIMRIDIMDRNTDKQKGNLIMPAVGFNYFIAGQNLKLQTMYQWMIKTGYKTDALANDDDNGLAEKQFIVQLQFAF
jgi:hypothetical protein